MTSNHRSWTKRDFYQILEVPSSATQAELRSAFRKLALQYHPDRFSTYTQRVWSTQKMAAINEAYGVLSNLDKRAAYDRLRGFRPDHPSPPRTSPSHQQRTNTTQTRNVKPENAQGPTASDAIMKKWGNLFVNSASWIILLSWLGMTFYLATTQYPTFKTGNIALRLFESVFLGGMVSFLLVMGFVASLAVTVMFLMGITHVFAEAFTKSKNTFQNQAPSRLWKDLVVMVTMLSVAIVIVLPAFLDWHIPWLRDQSGVYGVIAWLHIILHLLSLLLIPFCCIEILAILVTLFWSRSVFRQAEKLMTLSLVE